MKKKIVWLVVSCLMVLALLAASCAKAEEKAPAPAAKEAAPVVKEAAPAVKEAAPAEAKGMVKVTLKKTDGTLVEKWMEEPRYGGTDLWMSGADPTGWDEASAGVPPYATQITWHTPTFEQLLEGRWECGPSGTGEIGWMGTGYWSNPQFYTGSSGGLAESWEFPDETTIIYHIRKGVRFALDPMSEASRLVNGREFTADDAAYNIRRIYFDIKASTMYSMAGVSRPTDVYATDKYTLVVKNAPGQQGYTWEYVGDWMRNYAPEVIKKYGYITDWRNVVGTGPFILKDYVRMSSATWVRNPNYWMKDPIFPKNQLPYIDETRVLVIPDMSTQMAALRTGKINRAMFCEEEAREIVKTSSPELKYAKFIYPVYYYLGFRVDKPELPWAPAFDAKALNVRRALHMAINWQEIVDTYCLGSGSVLNYKIMPLKENPDLWEAYTPVEKLPPAPDGFDNKKLYTYHPEEAKALLTKTGYPQGFKCEAIISSAATKYIDMLTIFQGYWKKNLNVDFFIDIKEPGSYYAMHNAKSYKEGNFIGRWGDQPYAMCNVRSGLIYNTIALVDPELDDYYNKMTAAYFDITKRTKILREMNLNVISKVYYYVPPEGYRYLFWWPWVKGYHGESSTGVDNGITQKYWWIDQELKKAMGR